jgi:signal transduction histidine kinase
MDEGGSESVTAAREAAGRQGIDAIRRSLALGEADSAIVRRAGKSLLPRVDAFVDAFYTRLITDPVATRILRDEARVIRLKRSLRSWFHQLFTEPWDEAYERSRESIGEAHVRLRMPTYLMVTAMSGLRRDVQGTILDLWDAEPEEARAAADAVGRALDMELTLMLLSFRRSERALAREKDRMVYAQRAARRFAHSLYDRVDAALCYADLAESDGERRPQWLARLRGVLRGLSRSDQRMRVHARVNAVPPERVGVMELCREALADVSVDASTDMQLTVDPPKLEAVLVAPAVQLAIEELAQNAVRHAPGGTIRVRCDSGPGGGTRIEVTDEGPGWAPTVREFRDIYSLGSGLGLSFCEVVAELHHGRIELFRAESGGAGVRLVLGQPVEADEVGE